MTGVFLRKVIEDTDRTQTKEWSCENTEVRLIIYGERPPETIYKGEVGEKECLIVCFIVNTVKR